MNKPAYQLCLSILSMVARSERGRIWVSVSPHLLRKDGTRAAHVETVQLLLLLGLCCLRIAAAHGCTDDARVVRLFGIVNFVFLQTLAASRSRVLAAVPMRLSVDFYVIVPDVEHDK